MLIGFLFSILVFQITTTKELVNKKEFVENEIIIQRQKNDNLKEKYSRNIHSKKEESTEKKKLKKRSSEIVAQSENFNLKLIDFSSSETELNLNFNGSFHSILNFIHYLEMEMNQFKIAEFKIKTSNNDLFFFLKLKNELIKNEKNIF